MSRRDSTFVRLYRRLLLLFPFEFRREYGAEMADVFHAQRADAARWGRAATIRLWLSTLGGFLRTAPGQHAAILRQDLVYACRTLRGSPTFTVTAVLVVALAVGANTAVFGLVKAVLLNPLPVREPARLVAIHTTDRQTPGLTSISTDNFADVRARAEGFEGLAAYSITAARLTTSSDPEELFAMTVSASYFDLLGVQPALGRTFRADEDRDRGAHPVAVLSHYAWVSTFGSDQSVVGRTVLLNGHPFVVIGVAPGSFRGTFGLFEPHLYVPLAMYETLAPGTPWAQGRRWRWLNVFGRLKPGVSVEQAQAAIAVLGDSLAREYPEFNTGRSLAITPLTHTIFNADQHGMFVRTGWVLTALVAVVLLAACANLANLMLVRAGARGREVALRVALGAGRSRVIRQLLTETVLLGLAGGVLGVVLAHATQLWLWTSRPSNFVRPAVNLGIDFTIVGFAFAVSVLAAMLFGLLPALQVSRADVNTTLKESARLPGLGATNRLRFALVAGEVAFSMIALAAAGLLVRSVREAQRIDPGFEVERVALMNYNLRGLHEGPKVRLFHQRILEELSAAPDVRAAAVSDRAPLAPGSGHTIMVAGQTPPPGAMGFLVDTASVSPGYFDVLGIEVVRGRAFSAADRPDSRPVAIVNETMASRFWPDRDPIGGRFQSRSMTRPVEIVGVVRNAKYETLGEPAQPFFYLPILQQQSSSPGPTGLLVGSRGDPSAAVASVRAAMRRLDPAIPLTNITTIASRVDEALWAPRTLATLVAAFGAIVLALGAIGIYGVMAVTVVQRRQEIGLRMALGALPGTILRMVLGRGLAATLAGVVVGVAIALPYAGLLRSLLFGISPWDPPTFLSVAAALIAVALVACYIPARRAARMDPAMTLKG